MPFVSDQDTPNTYLNAHREQDAASDHVMQHRVDDPNACKTEKQIMGSLLATYSDKKKPIEYGVTVWIEVWIQEVTAINEITADFQAQFPTIS